HAMIRFLRLGLWLPFLLFFVFPQKIGILGVSAAALCTCYHYLTRKTFFVGEDRPAILIDAARETLLQTFFLVLLAEIWWSNWLANWMKLFETAPLSQSVATGFGVLAVVLMFVFAVNCFCRYAFEDSAGILAKITSNELSGVSWSSSFGALA